MCASVARTPSAPVPSNLTELAILELTNGEQTPNDLSMMRTTKDVYLWAALLASVAEERKDIEPEAVLRIYKQCIQQNLDRVKDILANWDPFQKERADSVMADIIVRNILKTFGLPISVDDLKKQASAGYVALVEKGLIQDPIFLPVGAAAIAVMGLVPIGFTQKTKDGEVFSRRIWGMFWEYERSSVKGVTQHKLEFRLLEFVRAFSRAAVAGFSGAIEDAKRGKPRRG